MLQITEIFFFAFPGANLPVGRPALSFLKSTEIGLLNMKSMMNNQLPDF
jgi:hypothetical protein